MSEKRKRNHKRKEIDLDNFFIYKKDIDKLFKII